MADATELDLPQFDMFLAEKGTKCKICGKRAVMRFNGDNLCLDHFEKAIQTTRPRLINDANKVQ